MNSSFRKMVMLSLEEYSRYKNQMFAMTNRVNAIDPMQKEFIELNENYGTNLPDDQRAKLESEIIQKHNSSTLPRAVSTVPTKILAQGASDNTRIYTALDNFPNASRKRARQLFNLLVASYNNTVWNNRGNLIKDGEVLKNSNILDLIHYVVSVKNTRRVPQGIEYFVSLLKVINPPLYLYGEQGRNALTAYDYAKSHEQHSSSDIDFSDEELQAYIRTPLKLRTRLGRKEAAREKVVPYNKEEWIL